jgi:RNA polymerase sigma-70 factor (ECF subfamily)
MEQVDKEIIKGIISGDQRAYSILIRLYFHPLTIYAKGILIDFEQAKDVVQEVFIKIWNSSGAININTSLKSFLYKTVHNACIDYLRKEKSRTTLKSISYDDLQFRLKVFDIQENESFFDTMFSDELELELRREIEQLPPQCKEIFILNRYGQLSYNDISEKLGISLSTVKTQMGRAMQKLMKVMLKHLHFFVSFV